MGHSSLHIPNFFSSSYLKGDMKNKSISYYNNPLLRFKLHCRTIEPQNFDMPSSSNAPFVLTNIPKNIKFKVCQSFNMHQT